LSQKRIEIFYYSLFSLLAAITIITIHSESSIGFAQLENATSNENFSSTAAQAWKTYKNELVGVSFDYPSGWDLSEKENRFDVTAADAMIVGDDAKFAIKVINRPGDTPLKSYALLSSTKRLEDAMAQSQGTTIIEHTDTKKYKIGGEKTGTFLTRVDNGGLASGMQHFIIFHNGDGYMLSFLAPADSFDSSETQDTMNKIIQSFKFLN